MSSNFVRFHEILNQALAENFNCLTQKLANPPLKSGSSFPNRHPLIEHAQKNLNMVKIIFELADGIDMSSRVHWTFVQSYITQAL